MAHALLSPSSAARWCTCPGSVGLTKDMPEEASPYADDGTRMHAKAAAAITARQPIPAQPGSPEELLNEYINFVIDESRGSTLMIEQPLDIGKITGEKGAKGTADAVVVKSDVVHVIDLKWGAGVPVDAENNRQLSIYAMAALDLFTDSTDFKRVRMTIVQPRVGDGRPRSWEISVEELNALRAEIRKHAATAMQMAAGIIEPTFCPSKDACRFCKARGCCKHFAASALSAAGIEPQFDSMDQPMTPAERGRLLDAVPVVEAWLKHFTDESLKLALDGGELPTGYKLVRGRPGVRKWADDEAAEKMLAGMKVPKAERTVSKVISPTAAQKLVKAQKLSEAQWSKLEVLVTRSEGALALAPESDKRPAVEPPSVAEAFPVIEEKPAPEWL